MIQARCHPGGTAFLVHVMQLGDLVCVYLCVQSNTPQTQVRKRQNRGSRNLSPEFPTNPDRWIEVNTCCRSRMPKYTALKTSLWALAPCGVLLQPHSPLQSQPPALVCSWGWPGSGWSQGPWAAPAEQKQGDSGTRSRPEWETALSTSPAARCRDIPQQAVSCRPRAGSGSQAASQGEGRLLWAWPCRGPS